MRLPDIQLNCQPLSGQLLQKSECLSFSEQSNKMAKGLMENILRDGLGYTCEFRCGGHCSAINNVLGETDMSFLTDFRTWEAGEGW